VISRSDKVFLSAVERRILTCLEGQRIVYLGQRQYLREPDI